MMKLLLLLFSILFIFSSCTEKESQEDIKISTNLWIGYAPLFYANEKGYLKDINIQLVINVSLAEAAEIYNIARAQMVTTTQHEYYSLKSTTPSLIPVILMDRSNGGDMILSNKTVQELKEADKIYAYLEIDSINAEILKSFIEKNGLDIDRINFIDQDQAEIQDVKYTKKHPILIVTYTPYDITLKKKGFKEIASTKDIESLIVIDSLCTKKEFFKTHKQRLQMLKRIIDRSINEIQSNPKESHKLISPYIGNIDYQEYLDALQTIKWINNPSKELLEHIKKLGYKEEYIIK